jgi:integrase
VGRHPARRSQGAVLLPPPRQARSLPGLPGSPEFNAAYEQALAGAAAPPAIGAKRVRAGSIGALALAYFQAPEFLALSASTRQTYRLIIVKFTAEHGTKPLALLTREHVNAMLARRVATPAAANHWLRLLRAMMQFAVTEGFRKDDPTTAVKFIPHRTDGFHTWSEDEIATFEAAHPVGSMARLTFGLALYTGSRRSDIVRMGRQHVRGGMVQVRQQKTGKFLAIPIHPELEKIIDATPAEHLTFLTTAFGQPFTAAGLGNRFRKWVDEAGLPPECALHGLRKAAMRRLAEAGCSANVIAAISGHKTLRMVEHYTRAADQERMARAGMEAIVSRTASGNRP